MSRDDAYLFDILDGARLVLEYVRGATAEDFVAKVQLQDAVIRRFEIIGEAARRVSEATRVARPDVPWAKMIGLGNLCIHQYEQVNLDVIWRTAHEDLPGLIAQLERIVPPDTP